jgi:ketosteroid isomerase-like protein
MSPTPTFTPTQAWASKTGQLQIKPLTTPLLAESLADHMAIKDVLARYGIAQDEGLHDVMATLFTDDAVLTVSEGGSPFQTVKGGPNIAKNAIGIFKHQTDQRRHTIANIVIDDLTDCTANVAAYTLVGVNGVSLGASCIYTGSLRKCHDGCWRFTRFWIGMDAYAGEKPDLPSITG